MNPVWEHHTHKLASLCCVSSGLTALWRNLTQLTCARRTGLESWAGVQTERNYHQAWFSSVTESLWDSCFVRWSSHPVICCSAATADGIKSSILVCLLTWWDKELQCSPQVWNSTVSFLPLICFLGAGICIWLPNLHDVCSGAFVVSAVKLWL